MRNLIIAMTLCAVVATVVFGAFNLFTFTTVLLVYFTIAGFASWRKLIASPLSLARFTWDFIYDLTKSNLVLAYDVLTPKDHYDVHFVEVPIDDLTPEEITFISHRITLTPGTLSCDIAENRRILVVHTMYPDTSALAEQGLALRRPLDMLKGRA